MYYELWEDYDEAYEELAHIKIYPDLPEGVSFLAGSRFETPLKAAIRCSLDPAWGPELPILLGEWIPIWRSDFISALQDAGVDNLDLYDAVIENPFTGQEEHQYKAVNVVGLVAAADLSKSKYTSFSSPPRIDTMFTSINIDESLTQGLLLFRMAESVSDVIVHEKIKLALEGQFPTLEFISAG